VDDVPADQEELAVGTPVEYAGRTASGEERKQLTRVVHVDHTSTPPSYTVALPGGERSTERSRLRAVSSAAVPDYLKDDQPEPAVVRTPRPAPRDMPEEGLAGADHDVALYRATRARYSSMTERQLRKLCSQSWQSEEGSADELIERLVEFDAGNEGWTLPTERQRQQAEPEILETSSLEEVALSSEESERGGGRLTTPVIPPLELRLPPTTPLRPPQRLAREPDIEQEDVVEEDEEEEEEEEEQEDEDEDDDDEEEEEGGQEQEDGGERPQPGSMLRARHPYHPGTALWDDPGPALQADEPSVDERVEVEAGTFVKLVDGDDPHWWEVSAQGQYGAVPAMIFASRAPTAAREPKQRKGRKQPQPQPEPAPAPSSAGGVLDPATQRRVSMTKQFTQLREEIHTPEPPPEPEPEPELEPEPEPKAAKGGGGGRKWSRFFGNGGQAPEPARYMDDDEDAAARAEAAALRERLLSNGAASELARVDTAPVSSSDRGSGSGELTRVDTAPPAHPRDQGPPPLPRRDHAQEERAFEESRRQTELRWAEEDAAQHSQPPAGEPASELLERYFEEYDVRGRGFLRLREFKEAVSHAYPELSLEEGEAEELVAEAVAEGHPPSTERGGKRGVTEAQFSFIMEGFRCARCPFPYSTWA